MTPRGRILILLGIFGLWAGIVREQHILSGLSLAVLIWIFLGWSVFHLRLGLRWPQFTAIRRINHRDSHQSTLWADRPLSISVEVAVSTGTIPPLTVIRDLLPDNLALMEESTPRTVVLAQRSVLRLDYRCRCRAAGRVEFFGIHFRFQDPQGLFLAERVLRQPQSLRVLPAFEQVNDARPTIKRINAIPQHGIHQLKRAGLGSELLELREYQPGDPPKSIAWKVSARRDRLMTRQYESEVPVRVTLMLDGSGSMRLGSFGERPLDQLNTVAASISKSAVSVGDPVGLVLLDDRIRRRLQPGNGDRAFFGILQALADFSMQTDPLPPRLSQPMLDLAIALCRERYPELLNRELASWAFSVFPLRPSRRRRLGERRQLAMVLAELYRLTPTQLLELVYDDRALAEYIVRWLHDLGLAWRLPAPGRDERRATVAASLLSQELLRAVAHAHDNELFVILANVLNADNDWQRLLPAVKVALSRHHRVVFICPHPTNGRAGHGRGRPPEGIDDVYRQVEEVRLSQRAQLCQRRLRGLGAQVAFTYQPHLVSTIMSEAELAGSGRFTLSGGR